MTTPTPCRTVDTGGPAYPSMRDMRHNQTAKRAATRKG